MRADLQHLAHSRQHRSCPFTHHTSITRHICIISTRKKYTPVYTQEYLSIYIRWYTMRWYTTKANSGHDFFFHRLSNPPKTTIWTAPCFEGPSRPLRGSSLSIWSPSGPSTPTFHRRMTQAKVQTTAVYPRVTERECCCLFLGSASKLQNNTPNNIHTSIKLRWRYACIHGLAQKQKKGRLGGCTKTNSTHAIYQQ